MMDEAKCTVAGCGERVHAKGYCSKHYEQIWRKGKICTGQEAGMPAKAGMKTARHDDETDRMRALVRELRRVEMLYRNITGLEGRLRWRREIEEVKKEMTRIGMPVPPPETGPRIPGNMAVGF